MRLLQSRVCRAWQPHLTIDCHATNGSVHRFAMTYDVPHTIAERAPRADPVHARANDAACALRLKQRTGLDSLYSATS